MGRSSSPGSGDEIFELELTTMAHGGAAIGRHNGRTIFVPYAIPGEKITARIVQDRGRFAYAEGVTLLEPSPYRTTPRCPHFGPGRCGGCHFQHIEYTAQLALKQRIVAEQLARIGGVEDAPVQPTIPSPAPWGYRTHATFHITEEGKPAFVGTDERSLIPIEECHIIRPELQELLEIMEFEPPESEGERIERVRIQVGSDPNDRLIAISTEDDTLPAVEIDLPVQVSFLSSDEEPQALIGTGKVTYTLRGRTFQTTAGSFFQVNLAQAETLIGLVLDRLALTGAESVLDLYSGVGLFTAFLAERAALVTAIEGSPTAVDDAEVNLADFENVTLVEGLVEEALSGLDGPVDCIVLDPPRTGVEPTALDAIIETGARRVVYVSCDPATLARDAKRLLAKGYQLVDVQPVDMFPQTFHIECVATFQRG
jgi:23S rRNA (uracil1939-C5)-methyltransferase